MRLLFSYGSCKVKKYGQNAFVKLAKHQWVCHSAELSFNCWNELPPRPGDPTVSLITVCFLPLSTILKTQLHCLHQLVAHISWGSLLSDKMNTWYRENEQRTPESNCSGCGGHWTLNRNFFFMCSEPLEIKLLIRAQQSDDGDIRQHIKFLYPGTAVPLFTLRQLLTIEFFGRDVKYATVNLTTREASLTHSLNWQFFPEYPDWQVQV
jgi:hypothetical protein